MKKQQQSFQTEQNLFLMSFSNNNNNKYLPNNNNHPVQKINHLHSNKNRKFIEDNFDQNQQYTQKQINNHNNNKIPSEIVSLLQNCKVSIKSLQQQVGLKNQQINKLSLQNMKLSSKLIQAQKQVQRNHQMLALYMKDSQNKGKVKQFHTVKEKSSQLDLNPNLKLENQRLKSEIEQQKQAIQQIKRQNQNLTFQNYHLKDEIRKLRSQINHLDQKVYKMGKGVGKALSTIKKNNLNSAMKNNPEINIFTLTENKQNSRNSINGKIVSKGQESFFSAKKITFQTPSKKVINKNILPTDEKYDSKTIDNSSQNNKKQQFTQKCQKKMEQISMSARRFNQIDKIESFLSKMQQLSQFHDSQEDLVEQ